jgi:hypothetical protein
MGASCDHWLFKIVKTDGTHFLALDLKLQHVLESLDVFRGQRNNFVFVKRVHEIINPVLAEGPVVANLTQPENNLKKMRVFPFLVLELQKSAFRLVPEIEVSMQIFMGIKKLVRRTGVRCISPVHEPGI